MKSRKGCLAALALAGFLLSGNAALIVNAASPQAAGLIIDDPDVPMGDGQGIAGEPAGQTSATTSGTRRRSTQRVPAAEREEDAADQEEEVLIEDEEVPLAPSPNSEGTLIADGDVPLGDGIGEVIGDAEVPLGDGAGEAAEIPVGDAAGEEDVQAVVAGAATGFPAPAAVAVGVIGVGAVVGVGVAAANGAGIFAGAGAAAAAKGAAAAGAGTTAKGGLFQWLKGIFKKKG